MAPDDRAGTSRVGGIGWLDDLRPSFFAVFFWGQFRDNQLTILVENIVGIRIFVADEKCGAMATSLVRVCQYGLCRFPKTFSIFDAYGSQSASSAIDAVDRFLGKDDGAINGIDGASGIAFPQLPGGWRALLILELKQGSDTRAADK